jgi:hypothetical protein
MHRITREIGKQLTELIRSLDHRAVADRVEQYQPRIRDLRHQ